jgi:hypothetical protein
MCKKLLLFLSYISLTRQMFMTPRFFSPFQNKTTNVTTTTTQYYPSLTPCHDYRVTPKRVNCDDALTIFRIWATLFVFTFPIISFPYHKENF